VSNPEGKDQGRLWVVVAAGIGLFVLGAVYYRFRSANHVWTLADHANVGNAMAPAVAFLTLLAVISALWSEQIQRTELALQRQELRETREEMVEQRKQFERTAEAQEALASSQASLADSQKRANKVSEMVVIAQQAGVQKEANQIALSAAQASLAIARNGLASQHSQHGSNVATYMAAIAHVRSAIATIHGETLRPLETKDLQAEITALVAQRDLEAKRMHALEKIMEDVDDGKRPL
jgi:hypothetical protein